MRKFGDNRIGGSDVSRAVDRSGDKYVFMPPLYLDDQGRDKVVRMSKGNKYGTRCFMLSSGGCSKCKDAEGSCDSCRPKHIAVPIVFDKDSGSAYAKCCEPVEVHFLFLQDWQVGCLKKFPCSEKAGDICLCDHSEIAGTCGDGCNVFCATFNEETNRWESDLQPSPVMMARAITGISPGSLYTGGLGCGEVAPQKLVSAEEGEDICGSQASRVFVDDDESLPKGGYECYEYELELKEDDCSTFCIRMEVTSEVVIAEGDVITCGTLIVKNTNTDYEITADRFRTSGITPGYGVICLYQQSGTTIQVKVCVCVTNAADAPADVDFNIKLTYSPVTSIHHSACAGSQDINQAPQIKVYNAGIYIPRNSIIPVQGLADCRQIALPQHALEASTCADNLSCECFGIANISKYATVSIRGVENSLNDPETGEPWEDSNKAQCGCEDKCEEWNRDFELQNLIQTQNGLGCCAFALLNHCAVNPQAPCGPYDAFPCNLPGYQTWMYFSAVCEPEEVVGSVPCGDPRLIQIEDGTPYFYKLRVAEFELMIKGCNGRIKFGFNNTVYINRSGPICITATSIAAPTFQNGPTTDTDCFKDFAVQGQPGKCFEGLGYTREAGGQLEYDFTGLPLTWNYDDLGADPLLVGIHDIGNCLWTMVPPKICIHRTK